MFKRPGGSFHDPDYGLHQRRPVVWFPKQRHARGILSTDLSKTVYVPGRKNDRKVWPSPSKDPKDLGAAYVRQADIQQDDGRTERLDGALSVAAKTDVRHLIAIFCKKVGDSRRNVGIVFHEQHALRNVV
jgi:hypothetical protein